MKIVSLIKLDDKIVNYLAKKAELKIIEEKDILAADIQDANVIVGNVDPTLLKKCNQLEWLQLYSAGNDQYREEDIPKGCILCNASGTFGENISEHLVMVTLMLFRNMPFYQTKQKEHEYFQLSKVKTIKNAKIMIVGTGDLGSQYAKKMQLFGAYTIGIKRNPVKQLTYFNEIYTETEVDELLTNMDVICLCLPKNESTNAFLNKDRLHKLKKDCIILNVGRGNAVETKELCSLLNSGRLLGAALDVFEKEPLSKEDMLWDTRNLIITPHVAGTFSNENTYSLFYEIVFDNLVRFFMNQELRNVVDFEIGYRKQR